MSNTNNTPLRILVQQIEQAAIEKYKNQGLIRMVSKREGYIDGATEYASKLHLLQQEYDKLKGEAENLAEALQYCAKPIEHNDANLALCCRQEIAKRALSSYKSQTNNQNNG